MAKVEKENPFSKTVLLPETNFPMKADLAKREPAQIEKWKQEKTFSKMQEIRKGKKTFTLHDGPPYANGNFHLGHALNKILKDIIVKSKNLSGFQAGMIPGWDCHGLPIEVQVLKNLGKDARSTSPHDLRKKCREYADQFVSKQGKDLDRFLCFWEESQKYLTMDPSFEAKIVEVFGKLFEKGYVYKGKKPVYWCIDLATAHAEAEIEYQNHTSPSIYVAFPIKNRPNSYCLIWTTTPWTLPANLAICFNPELDYAFYSSEGKDYILAEGLAESVSQKVGKEFIKTKRLTNEELKAMVFQHPFLPQDSIPLFGPHVTLDAGTGCVHTAPGHGTDDYRVGTQAGLPAYSPVDDYGRYTDEFPMMKGIKIWDANPKIVELLKEKEALLHYSEFQHSYPHSWRSKKPLIFRATPQWFLSIDHNGLRSNSLSAIQKVKWIPDWGISRIQSMVESRPDWCLSRQRNWGVPIPSFTCQNCGETHLTKESIQYFIDIVKQKGIEVWYSEPAESLLPPNSHCTKCNSTDLKQDKDILDVWFDSGVSNFAVFGDSLDSEPADLYLEGSDQHRGWFQSSLWPSMALRGFPPYRSVLTHGYTLDDQGRAMSKSLGNGIEPSEVIGTNGADVLRLWISSQDFRDDLRLTKDGIKLVSESYRKIRNTFRYLLGNCASKQEDSKPALEKIDAFYLSKLAKLNKELQEYYNNYQFHLVYQRLLLFISGDLSQDYFEIIRDRMYCNHKDSKERKSSAFALRKICESLALLVAPILSFTAEEVWQELGNTDSVFFHDFRDLSEHENANLDNEFAFIFEVKESVQKALEEARKKGSLGKSLEGKVLFFSNDPRFTSLSKEDWALYLVVSQVEIDALNSSHPAEVISEFKSESYQVMVTLPKEPECPRCWRHTIEMGEPDRNLCHRCESVV